MKNQNKDLWMTPSSATPHWTYKKPRAQMILLQIYLQTSSNLQQTQHMNEYVVDKTAQLLKYTLAEIHAYFRYTAEDTRQIADLDLKKLIWVWRKWLRALHIHMHIYQPLFPEMFRQ